MKNANKAWIAALVAALTTFVATVQGRTDVDTMGAVDWLIVVLSAVIAGASVWAVPNKPTEPEAAPPEAGPGDGL